MTPHQRITLALVAESLGVYVALAAATLLVWRADPPYAWLLLAPLVVAQGCWLDRLYTAAHEAIHHKLCPGAPLLNDALGRLLLLPVVAPFTVYRKIHVFHHGQNRRDYGIATLDTFVSRRPLTPARRATYHATWLFFVYGGGFFLHSLASIVLFLVVPTRRATRINPVFVGWRADRRAAAWLEVLTGLAFHALAWTLLGPTGWMLVMGLPLAVFAWVWSLLLYVYHYGTTVGRDVRHNVRSLPRQPLMAWLLLNFNEHATHHFDPSIPWYELPRCRHALPAAFAANENVTSLWQAVWQQRHGPILVDPAEVHEFSVPLFTRRPAAL